MGAALLATAVILLLVVSISFDHIRGKRKLEAWVNRHGYTLVNAERRLFRGPFFLRSAKNDVVFRFTIKDSDDQLRSGHLLVRMSLLRRWIGEPEIVQWDE